MDMKGYYFSIDAMIAAALLMIGLILASSLYVNEPESTSIEQYSIDLLNIMSNAKLNEINNSYVDQLILSGKIDNTNKSLLEQAAQFWAEGNASLANSLLNITIGSIPGQFGFGIYMDNELIKGSSANSPSNLVSSKTLISGIAKDKPVSGFTARAQLTSFESRGGSSYYYFGGFVGQGNITARLDLPPSILNITSAYLELDSSDNFTLHVNDKLIESFIVGSGGDRMADKWYLNESSLGNFTAGANSIKIDYQGNYGFIGGGFLKVSYLTSGLNSSVVTYSSSNYTSKRYYFPKIEGFINLFDSFFVPGTLNSASAYIHYASNLSTFFNIGNVTVWNLDSGGTQFIYLPNSDLDSKLDYVALSSVTVPIRFGATEGGNSTTIGFGGTADVILVNDLSGSMEWCVDNACTISATTNEYWCGTSHKKKPYEGVFCNYSTEDYALPGLGNLCSDRWHGLCPVNDVRKIDVLVNASQAFTNVILEASGNRLGHVGYSSPWDEVIPAGGSWSDRFAPFPDGIVAQKNLSDNFSEINTHFTSTIDSYWATCICCGVKRAREIYSAMSDSSRHKALVVMSDGEATDKCGSGVGIGQAKVDAIDEAQDACNIDDIAVSSVALGTDADADTLQQMVCNGGKFYNASNVEDLISIYTDIATEIKNITYELQLINVSGGIAGKGILYGDSYVELNYTPSTQFNFGVIEANLESSRFGNNISDLTLNILANSEIADISVTSYSGQTWTDNLTVTNGLGSQTAYSLRGIAADYLSVGDAFVVYADPFLFQTGNNDVHISTGSGPANYTGGSDDNLIIYSVRLPNYVLDGDSFSKSDGCKWMIEFETNESINLSVPSGYGGSEICEYLTATYPMNDATDDAVYRLLSILDFDGDGLLDVKFGPQDLGVNVFTVSNVPSLWGPTVVEVRAWQ